MLKKSETGIDLQTVQYCFPHINSSCIKNFQTEDHTILLYIVISGISISTVFLNLLVIISISHFKQLHTPTNLIILSLAVTDLIVGLIVMPVQGIQLLDSCWYFGDTFCKIFPYFLYVIVTASLGNLILISVDRYIAVTDPLRYPTQITNNITVCFIVMNWSLSLLFNVCFLSYATIDTVQSHTCFGDCKFNVKFEYVIIDVIFTFIGPCTIILSLYLKIFWIAKQQAQNLISSTNKKACLDDKAARTIGIVVVVYLLTYIPYYITDLALSSESKENVINIMYWILCLNSFMNPLIYALFYRWFRITIKHILTLRICEPLSEYFNPSTDNEV